MLAVLKCFDEICLNCVWKIWHRQNLSGWRHLDVNLCAESSTPLQRLQTADTGRDGNHKGFVNIHTIKRNNLWAPEHFDVLFGHCSFYFLSFFNKWKSIVHDNENNEQSTFTKGSRELFFLQLACTCGSDSRTVWKRESKRQEKAKNTQIPQPNLNPLIRRWWHHCRTLQQRNVFEEPSTVLHLVLLLLKSRYTFSLLFFFLRSSAHNLKQKVRFPFDYWI